MSFLDKWQTQLLAILRIVTGLLFLEHGTSKLLHFPHLDMFDHLQVASLFGAAGIIELVGGILVVLGLFSRVAAFVMSGEMAVAYFMMHAPQNFFPVLNMGEAAILFCFVFLYLAAAGPGAWAINRR